MSTRSLGTLTLDVVAKTGNFEGPLDKATRNAEKNAKQMEATAARIGAAAGVIAATGFAALTAATGFVIAETIQAQKEQAQLEAVLKSTGFAAGFNADQLNAMADSLERTSTVSAGEINEAQTSLLAFTNIVGDQFTSALQAAVDMSARTGMSVVSAAETIGRSLDVPSQGMAALSRQGFRWSEAQKEVIKQLEATGKTAEAQRMILDALETTYGGAAKAARETFGGALQGLKNTIAGLATGDGGSLDSATRAINSLSEALNDDRTKQGISNLVAGLAGIANFAITATARVAELVAELPGFWRWATNQADEDNLGELTLKYERLKEAVEAYNASPTFRSREVALQQAAEANRVKARIDALLAEQKAEAEAAATRMEAAKATQAQTAAENAAAEASKAAAEAAKKAAEEASRAEEARKKRIADQLKDLETQVATLGMNSQELVAYKLAADGASASDIKRAQALRRVLDEQEFLAKWMNSNVGEIVAAEFVQDEENTKEKEKKRLDELKAMFDTEREKEIERYDQQLEDFNEYAKKKELSEEEARIRREELEDEHEKRMAEIKDKGRKSTINSMQDMYRLTSTLMNSENRKLFELGKAAALANGTISAIESVIDSYKFGAKLGGPVLGATFAAAAAVAQYAQLDAIRSASFGGGGSAAAPSVTQSLNNNATPVDAGGSGRNVYVHGIDPSSLFSGQQVVDLINDAVENGAVLRVAA